MGKTSVNIFSLKGLQFRFLVSFCSFWLRLKTFFFSKWKLFQVLSKQDWVRLALSPFLQKPESFSKKWNTLICCIMLNFMKHILWPKSFNVTNVQSRLSESFPKNLLRKNFFTELAEISCSIFNILCHKV